jgi:hypothetical protein
MQSSPPWTPKSPHCRVGLATISRPSSSFPQCTEPSQSTAISINIKIRLSNHHFINASLKFNFNFPPRISPQLQLYSSSAPTSTNYIHILHHVIQLYTTLVNQPCLLSLPSGRHTPGIFASSTPQNPLVQDHE